MRLVGIVAMRGRPNEEGGTSQRFEFRKDDCTNTLTSVQKDNLVVEKAVLRSERTPYGKAIRKAYESKSLYEKRSNMRALKPRKDGITNTLTTVQKDNLVLEIHSKLEKNKRGDDLDQDLIKLGNINPSGRGMNGDVFSAEGLCPTITTNKGEGQKIADPTIFDVRQMGREGSPRIYHSGITPTITARDYKDPLRVGVEPNGAEAQPVMYRVRKLTQKECWRLMGFEDEDFYKAQKRLNENVYGGRNRSGWQLYKQAGNSIVVDVLVHIMNELLIAMPYLFEDIKLGSFFSGIGAFEKALQRLPQTLDKSDKEAFNDIELNQLGHINDSNAAANRIYSDEVSVTLKAEAGGGGAKTGWYKIQS